MTTSADCCYSCGGDSRVLETRQRTIDGGIRRRRRCMRCGLKWTTAELRVQPGQTVVCTPVQAVRALRDKMMRLLDLLGVEQADFESKAAEEPGEVEP